MLAQLQRHRGFWISRVGEVVLAQAFLTLAFLAQIFAARAFAAQSNPQGQPASQGGCSSRLFTIEPVKLKLEHFKQRVAKSSQLLKSQLNRVHSTGSDSISTARQEAL